MTPDLMGLAMEGLKKAITPGAYVGKKVHF